MKTSYNLLALAVLVAISLTAGEPMEEQPQLQQPEFEQPEFEQYGEEIDTEFVKCTLATCRKGGTNHSKVWTKSL